MRTILVGEFISTDLSAAPAAELIDMALKELRA